MDFNQHSAHAGSHAFLSASKYHWLNYDDDALARSFHSSMAARRGTELHALAHNLITLGVRLPDIPATLSLYVNDGIGFRMKSEQMLFYSNNCFGTPDTISFRRNKLRIHDLKTGVNKASFFQLMIYAALFCLEYGFEPIEIEIELRIYQNDDVIVYEATAPEIKEVMEKIVRSDKRIEELRQGMLA